MVKRMLLTLVTMVLAVAAQAAVKSEVVTYTQGDATMQGWVASDASRSGKRPGVVLVHDWMGATEHQKAKAEALAAEGYVVLVADVYGRGVRPADSRAAAAEAGKFYGDRGVLRARLKAALDQLAVRKDVDATRLAAIGYCFGGMSAIEMARAGMPLKGVVSFHGSLGAADPADAKNVKAKLLVLHGADDPYVKPDEVKGFMDEMNAAKVDWQMVHYSGAVHSFTDVRAGTDNGKGAAYNAAADRRSWRAMLDFFRETLK